MYRLLHTPAHGFVVLLSQPSRCTLQLQLHTPTGKQSDVPDVENSSEALSQRGGGGVVFHATLMFVISWVTFVSAAREKSIWR